jgi:hypothetical protein
MSIIKSLLAILLIGAFSLPSVAQGNLKSYYFRLKDFREPKVYVMVNHDEPELSRYFHMEADGNTLTTKIYDWEGNLAEESVEVYEKKGSRLQETTLFYFNGQDEILRNEMLYGPEAYVYLWRPKRSFGYTGIVELEYDGQDRISRERTAGKKSTLEVLGKKRKAIHISDAISIEGPGWDPLSFQNDVYYAKKLGIVRVDMHLPEGDFSLYLSEIISEAEWLQRIR